MLMRFWTVNGFGSTVEVDSAPSTESQNLRRPWTEYRILSNYGIRRGKRNLAHKSLSKTNPTSAVSCPWASQFQTCLHLVNEQLNNALQETNMCHRI